MAPIDRRRLLAQQRTSIRKRPVKFPFRIEPKLIHTGRIRESSEHVESTIALAVIERSSSRVKKRECDSRESIVG